MSVWHSALWRAAEEGHNADADSFPGMGPVEARHFVRMLADMLTQELLMRAGGERIGSWPEAEPSSVDLPGVVADRTVMADLLGTHALIMQSPHRSKRSRKRWYAGVSTAPTTQPTANAIDASDVLFETCRASGAGGQHVNKTGVRGARTACTDRAGVCASSERSPSNKQRALDTLANMLAKQEVTLMADAKTQRRDRSLQVERGRPVATWRWTGSALMRVDPREGCCRNHEFPLSGD